MTESAMTLPSSLSLQSLAKAATVTAPAVAEGRLNTKMMLDGVSVLYHTFIAVAEVNLLVYANKITAIIGPSGCGKSTLLRALNRMNDLIPARGSRVPSCWTRTMCTRRTWTWWTSAAAWAWCFSAPILFPRASMTTWLTGRACTAA